MSQEPNRNESKQPRFGNRPGGGDDPNNPPKKGPKFSIYWIYAIIFAVLIGFQLFGPFSPNAASTNNLAFKKMILAGEVSKYVIVDNRKTVKIYLTKDACSAARMGRVDPATFGEEKFYSLLKGRLLGKEAE